MLKSRTLKERVLAEADYIFINQSTIRLTARRFKVSKSTVHQDLTQRLYKIDKTLYNKVRRILDYNISQRAIRGGEATRKKYKNNPKSSV